MSLLDRLAHARALDRLAGGAGHAGPQPRPTTSMAQAPTQAPFVRRERVLALEPSSSRDSAPEGRARGFGERRGSSRQELRGELLGGCLAPLRLPSGPELARDLVCLGAPSLADGVGYGTAPVFLDTETTGMGGAAVAFVVGLAWIDGGQLRCVQWTLGQCRGEAELLADVLAQLDALGPAPLVSFNGASFDLPLLRLRARHHGLAARALDRQHLDLLHPARRLYGRRRGASDCKLTTLERTLLGVVRRGDIDSAAIPEVFWTWLQAPHDRAAQRRLQAVCDHNFADLATLPALASKLAATVRAPDDLDRAARAARHLERIGAAEQARLVLARCVEPGGGVTPAPEQRAHWRAAALQLAMLERRRGDRDRAAALWQAAYRADPGCPEACEAWAKHLEHTLGDFAEALRVTRGSRAPCPRRIARLEARLEARRARAEGPEPTPAAPSALGDHLEVEIDDWQPMPAAMPTSGAVGSGSVRPLAPVHPRPEARSRELRTRIDQSDAGAVVRYRLLR